MAAGNSSLNATISELKSLVSSFNENSLKLKSKSRGKDLDASVEVADTAWRSLFLEYACSRVVSLVTNENIGSSSLGTLATARYVFELRILVKNLISGRLYGIVCARSLIQDRLNHEKALLEQHQREIELYEDLQAKESKGIVSIAKGHRGDDLAAMMEAIDNQARLSLCLYHDKAKHWGYGYWAERMKTEIVPNIEANIGRLERELREFEARYPFFSEPNPLPREIRWKGSAKEAGLQGDLNFIYASTSRLLHCLPGSLVVSEQELTDIERVLYAKSVLVNLRMIESEISLFLSDAADVKH